jgi:hypothetical protein
MPDLASLLKDPYFYQQPPDQQIQHLAAVDPEFSYLPPEEQAKVLDFGRARYGAPGPAAPPNPVKRLNDPLSRVAAVPQNLTLGAREGISRIAQTKELRQSRL